MDNAMRKDLTRKLVFVLGVVCNVIIGISAGRSCGVETFRISQRYKDLKPVEIPANELQLLTRMECANRCYKHVACTGFFYNNGDGLCSVYSTRLHSLSFRNKTGTQAYERVPGVPSDCYDVMMLGGETNGVYAIQPHDNGASINGFCDIASSEDGWLVIQRRTDGSEDFYRTWDEYRDGFGDLNNEFWLGNTNIHRITIQGHYDLRIDLEDFEGNTRYALYKDFSLAPEQDYFRLIVGQYSGNAGDSLSYHSGYGFSAKNLDVDASSDTHCAQKYKGAWWYMSCHYANLNGLYLGGIHSSYGDGIEWHHWRGDYYSMKTSVMKIRQSVTIA